MSALSVCWDKDKANSELLPLELIKYDNNPVSTKKSAMDLSRHTESISCLLQWYKRQQKWYPHENTDVMLLRNNRLHFGDIFERQSDFIDGQTLQSPSYGRFVLVLHTALIKGHLQKNKHVNFGQ